MIHPTAIVHPDTDIHPSVEIGPYCVIGSDHGHLRLGPGCVIRSHSIIEGGSIIGDFLETGHHALLRTGNEVGVNLRLGSFSSLEGGASIGDYCRIHGRAEMTKGIMRHFARMYAGCYLTDNRLPPSNINDPAVMDEGSVIAIDCIVIAGVRLGIGSFVGANTTVTRDVPDGMALVGGRFKPVTSLRWKGYAYPWTGYYRDGYPPEAWPRIEALDTRIRLAVIKASQEPEPVDLSIPVLVVPTLRPDLVRKMLATVDAPVGITLIIDNGGQVGNIEGATVVPLPHNIGVGAAWNLAMKLTPRAPWWAFVNDDVLFHPGELGNLASCASQEGPRIVIAGGFHCFAMNAEALARVGYWDENYHPAYVEDCDMERRAQLAGVPIMKIEPVVHHQSSTIAVPEYRRQNARSYEANVSYHKRKWGGGVRSGEHLLSPFGNGQGIDTWTLDPKRLIEQGWETAMVQMPEDEQR